MGIKQLMQLLLDKTPEAIKNISLNDLQGRVIACDASITIYQFLISTQFNIKGHGVDTLKDESGNQTGHLVGLFNRNIQFIENGIKPIWVFDGAPPELKSRTLEKRKELKEKAEEAKEAAQDEGDEFTLKKMSQRTVKISKQMIEDAKRLVKLMGIPMIQAAGEAEAQCAYIAQHGKAFATASEDMDSLTFGSPILLRGLGNKKNEDLVQINFDLVLKGLKLTMDQFIDLCILCGCDYAPTIAGIGPTRAYKFILENKTIEKVLYTVEKENAYSNGKKLKYIIPSEFNYEEVRELFKQPSVTSIDEVLPELKWEKPNEDALREFLVKEKGFNEEKVEKGLKKILKNQGNLGKTQVRLDNFFKANTASTKSSSSTPNSITSFQSKTPTQTGSNPQAPQQKKKLTSFNKKK